MQGAIRDLGVGVRASRTLDEDADLRTTNHDPSARGSFRVSVSCLIILYHRPSATRIIFRRVLLYFELLILVADYL